VLDAAGLTAEARTFFLGHAAALDVLRGAATELDWLVALAVALIDEIENPKHHRTLVVAVAR
jgi:hypothetical protein